MNLMDSLWALLLVAIIVLVVAIALVMRQLIKVLKETENTIKQTQTSLSVITDDVNHLSKEVETLLNQSNQLMADMNHKMDSLDPLFKATGEVGQSISKVNATANNLAKRFTLKRGYSTGNAIIKLNASVRRILTLMQEKNKKK